MAIKALFPFLKLPFFSSFLLFYPVHPRVFWVSSRLIAEDGQNVTIFCNASGRPQPKVTWLKAVGTFQKGRTAVVKGALTIYKVTKNDGGTYICKAENMLGSVSVAALLVIFSPLRFKVRPPQEVSSARFGSTLRLPCAAESDLRPRITWTRDGKFSLPGEFFVLQNGTLVIQNIKKSHQGFYTCRATNAVKTIEAKVKINSPVTAASCSAIRKYVSVSGNYVIDPDGEGGQASFSVYCDMTDKNGVGVTVISHDSESRTFVVSHNRLRDIHYTGASLSQLASLTRISSQCEQFIKYECSGSHLRGSWWLSRDSKRLSYWGGASPGSGKCACGMTNSCANTGDRCNCDKDDWVWREDSGLLTDKTTLPVKQLYFPDVGGREKGYHTLGKLKCYGTA